MRVVKTVARNRRARAVALTVALLGLSAVPAAAVTSGTYTGKTSQHDPVKAVLSGNQVTRFTITWHAHCKIANSKLGPLKTFHSGIKLNKQQGWNITGSYPASSGNGYTEKFSVKDHATFSAHTGKFHGTFSGSVKVYRDSTSKYVDTCTSGKIAFTLTHT